MPAFIFLEGGWEVSIISQIWVALTSVLSSHNTGHLSHLLFYIVQVPLISTEWEEAWPMGACTQNLWGRPVLFWHCVAGSRSIEFCGFRDGASVVWARCRVSRWCLTSLGSGGFEARSTPWTLAFDELFLWWQCPAMRTPRPCRECFCGLHQCLGRWDLSKEDPH